MDKRIIILFSVVVALWAGFMVFRHVKGKREGQEFKTKEYARITEVAKQSPKAGLNQMARALKKYYQERRRFPQKLDELYPEYIRNKSFLDELDWHYSPEKDNFLLTKTVVRQNKRMVAYVDKRVNPWVKGGVMVASPTETPEKKMRREAKERIAEKEKISAESREQFWQALRRKQTDLKAVHLAERDKEKVITIPQPEILGKGPRGAATPLEKTLGHRYLVWKSKEGTLGFGNVEYPVSETQSRYAMGAWYNLKIPGPEKAEPVPAENLIEEKGAPEAVASRLAPKYLVWKGERGNLGFGNVQYPDKDPVHVYETDTWVHVAQPEEAMESVPPEEYTMPKTKSREGVASDFSRQYLVWKDQNGTLGFGNVQCPETGSVSIYQTDTWVEVEKSPLPLEAGGERAYQAARGPSPERAVPQFSPDYLVWKDRHGNLGFGNVTYPEAEAVSQVHVNGDWESVLN